MDKKLTLSLNAQVIDRAKEYARDREVSLSRLIENYLASLVEKKEEAISVTPLVDKLSGVVNIPEDYHHKSDYTDYLINKYK